MYLQMECLSQRLESPDKTVRITHSVTTGLEQSLFSVLPKHTFAVNCKVLKI
uniref:Uncharacterized protein n=1 Tax=Ciona intestinalis TaxID=7719 RepID=H2XND7_CIOIN